MPNLVLEIAENGRQLHLRRGSVAVMAGEECLGLVPVDSLACVLLTADGIMLSKAFMARMAEEGVPVVICGDNYMPVSVSLPTAPHYRALPVVTAQMRASPVLKKRLWQQCIAAKLRNQGRVLRLCRPESPVADQILALSGKVRSGDTDNKEAQAARLYWPALLGADFLRNPEGGGPNAALNYGYKVLLSCVNREVAANGCLTQLGINHCNEFNEFNFSCDLMEPFRVVVDECVYLNKGRELDKEYKHELVNLLNKRVRLERECDLHDAVGVCVKSAIEALNGSTGEKLRLYNFE